MTTMHIKNTQLDSQLAGKYRLKILDTLLISEIAIMKKDDNAKVSPRIART